MAAKRTEKLALRNSRIILTSTTFDHAGDSVEVKANVRDELVYSKYVRRHIAFRGHFSVSFPNTTEVTEVKPQGTVFPTKEKYQLDNYKYMVTADEDNSTYYCVLPGYQDCRLIEEFIELDAGQLYQIIPPKVVFSFGRNYTAGENIHNDSQVFCCENSSLTITANEPCKLLVYSTFKITAV